MVSKRWFPHTGYLKLKKLTYNSTTSSLRDPASMSESPWPWDSLSPWDPLSLWDPPSMSESPWSWDPPSMSESSWTWDPLSLRDGVSSLA